MIPKGTPKRIYLQLGPEKVERNDKFSDYDEVTWCTNKIDDYDIEYIRADAVMTEPTGTQALPPGFDDLHKTAGVFVKLFERGVRPQDYLSAHDWVELCRAWNRCPEACPEQRSNFTK